MTSTSRLSDDHRDVDRQVPLSQVRISPPTTGVYLHSAYNSDRGKAEITKAAAAVTIRLLRMGGSWRKGRKEVYYQYAPEFACAQVCLNATGNQSVVIEQFVQISDHYHFC